MVFVAWPKYWDESALLTFLAGLPAMVMPASRKEVLTTEFAPITILSAIWIFPNTMAPGAMNMLFPNVGQALSEPACVAKWTQL
jgi:hypothetical protein